MSSKESAYSARDRGDTGLIPELGRYLGRGNGNPPQYSCLENPMVGYSPWGCKESNTMKKQAYITTKIRKS